jgi:succinoglycan biosynthesis protein ExoA
VAAVTARVDVIMGVKNEGAHLIHVLRDLAAQDSEILGNVYVALAPSSDDTESILRGAQNGILRDRLVVIPNPQSWVAIGLNLALARSTTSYVARVDGHCSVPPDFLSRLREVLDQDPTLAYAGPRMVTAQGLTTKETAIALAMESPVGVGPGNFRLAKSSGYVETVLLGVYRRAHLDEVGAFDERLLRNQDDELHSRLGRAGFRIWMEADVQGVYFPRTTYADLFKQYYGFGWWKYFAAVNAGGRLRAKHVAPAAFVLATGAAVHRAKISRRPLVVVLTPYAAALAVHARSVYLQTKSVRVARQSVAASVAMHAGYGTGFLRAVARQIKPGQT